MTAYSVTVKALSLSMVTTEQINKTVPGMAHWAGTGPKGKTCRECISFATTGQRYASKGGKHAKGELMPSRCAAYRRLKGEAGKPVPHWKQACKHFEPSPNPQQGVKVRD